MADAVQKAVIDSNLQKVLEQFAQAKLEAAQQRASGEAVRWFRPPLTEWNGALQTAADLIGLHRAFQTDEAEAQLISAFDPKAPGNVGDGVVLPLQIDYMMQAERAYRARTTQGFPRAVAHVLGRERGHGQATSVFLGQALTYFLTLLKQGAG